MALYTVEICFHLADGILAKIGPIATKKIKRAYSLIQKNIREFLMAHIDNNKGRRNILLLKI